MEAWTWTRVRLCYFLLPYCQTMKCVEICAGMGSFSFGVRQAGFDHAAMIEIDERCVETLKKNKFTNVIHADVKTFDFRPYKGVHVVCGGPPCTPFSVAGKHKGWRDPRNLWPHVIRAIREIQPQAFLFENIAPPCAARPI